MEMPSQARKCRAAVRLRRSLALIVGALFLYGSCLAEHAEHA